MTELHETHEILIKDLERGRTEAGGVLSLRFPFLWANVRSANGHIYRESDLKRAVAEVQAVLERRAAVYGSTQHLDKIEVDDVSHLISQVEYKDDAVWATVHVVPTRRGKDLSAIILHGGQVGVSARGRGTVLADGEVKDYRLDGVDFVLAPSFDDASVTAANRVYESREVDEEKIAALKERYRMAQVAGFKGSFLQYRRIGG